MFSRYLGNWLNTLHLLSSAVLYVVTFCAYMWNPRLEKYDDGSFLIIYILWFANKLPFWLLSWWYNHESSVGSCSFVFLWVLTSVPPPFVLGSRGDLVDFCMVLGCENCWSIKPPIPQPALRTGYEWCEMQQNEMEKNLGSMLASSAKIAQAWNIVFCFLHKGL
jgi:hypothetical protein